MTFKEKLIVKANQINIQKEMAEIKQDMEDYFSYRKYTVKLYRARCQMAIGGVSGLNKNYREFFIPYNLTPREYIGMFLTAFKELGFDSKDITLNEESGEY